MSTSVYPVRVDATLDPGLNRWLWMLKWVLVIPHYVILVFLWLCFAVLSVVAFFAILFTGNFPRPIFDFNVGVLRWSWRVAYYAYGTLGTDRYPPFSLAEVADYPAHLEADYPEHLSRGLDLVKWWLLAIPHYLVVAVFVGGGLWVFDQAANAERAPGVSGVGLIGLMVLIAAVVLLVTGRYPQPIFDLVLGMNRWVLRVAAYAALMTDQYPPFRLDMGPEDPRGGQLAVATSGAPQAPAPAPAPTASSEASGAWSSGRIIALTLGSLIFLVAGGLLTGGVSLVVAQQTMRDDAGFIMTGQKPLATSTYALVSESMQLHMDGSGPFVPDRVLGDVKLRVAPTGDDAVFVGVGASADVRAYLANVEHATVVDFATISGNDGDPVYRDSPAGAGPVVPPGDVGIWAEESSGQGTRTVLWPPQSGDWTVVVMNADGSADIAVDVAVGAQFPAVAWVIGALLSIGGFLLIVCAVLIIGALRAGSAGGGRRPVPSLERRES